MFEDVLVKVEDKIFLGKVVFKFYDIYGFLFDLIVDVCCECDILIDEVGFDVEMIV